MIKDPETDRLKPFDFELIYEYVPELKRIASNISSISFDKPIDSSDMSLSHWENLSNLIQDNYDGEILHVLCKFGWISSPFADMSPLNSFLFW